MAKVLQRIWLPRFRTRTLLILLAIVSVGLGWYSANARQHRREIAALDEIELLLQPSNDHLPQAPFLGIARHYEGRFCVNGLAGSAIIESSPTWLGSFLHRGFECDILHRVVNLEVDNSTNILTEHQIYSERLTDLFSELKSLKQLKLISFKIDEQSLHDLRDALPDVEIVVENH